MCVDVSLGFLFCSIDLYFCLCASTILSWWLWLCSRAWSQVGWFLQFLAFNFCIFYYYCHLVWVYSVTSIYICLIFKWTDCSSFSSVQFSCSVVSDSLRPHESQHVRPPCPSPSPRVHSISSPSSRWCHPAISSFVIPFSSCPQSLPASESFPMSQLFTWGGQSTGVSALASFQRTPRADLL